MTDFRIFQDDPHTPPEADRLRLCASDRRGDAARLRSSMTAVHDALLLVVRRAERGGSNAMAEAARDHCLRALEGFADQLAADFRVEAEVDALGMAVVAAPRYHRRAELLRRDHRHFTIELAGIRAEARTASDGSRWRSVARRFGNLTRRLALHEAADNELVAIALLEDIGGRG